MLAPRVVFVVAKDEVLVDFDDFLLLPRAILPQSRGQQEVLAAILRQEMGVLNHCYGSIPSLSKSVAEHTKLANFANTDHTTLLEQPRRYELGVLTHVTYRIELKSGGTKGECMKACSIRIRRITVLYTLPDGYETTC